MRRLITVGLVLLGLSLSPAALAQIPNVVDTTSTPIPGAGHDYIHMISETVNPANGSVSLRIQVPMPNGRGVTIPFSFNYDSNGITNLTYIANGQTQWRTNSTPLSSGGWGYSVPQLTLTQVNDSTPNSPCYYNTDYVFQDASGGRHSLYLEVEGWEETDGILGNCGNNILTGGDGPYTATTQAVPCCASEGFPPVTVSDSDGTIYYFLPSFSTNSWALPSYIEDRNGNKIVFSTSGNTFTMTDTLGNAALNSSGFGTSGVTNTLAVGGLSPSYQITWETVTAAYNLSSTADNLSGSPYCAFPNVNNSFTVIKYITLPNGQQYQFSYDPTYGLLSQITYPSGGWIKYTWKLSDQLSELAYLANSAGALQSCPFEYKVPVIATRQVGYSPGSAAETQSFSAYDTTWSTNQTGWTQKSVTATTTDAVRSQSFNTSYKYTPFGVAQQPGDFYNVYAGQLPLESQIQYYNFGGGLLRTVNKTWNTPYQLATQQTVLNDGNNPYPTSQIAYLYTSTGPGAQVSQKSEYDFGQSSPTRTTTYAYQPFTGTPGTILDRPSGVVIHSGSATGTRIAETDYTYDQFSVGSASATEHDPNYGTSSTIPRGNPTTVTRQCLQSCANPVTKYTYDETGQILTMIDPLIHTTGYSYLDNYSNGCSGTAPPSGNTNAYLTKVTDPLGHFTSYCYGYNDGQLRGVVDENSQTTNYAYVDSLGRLTSSTFPDNGGTSYLYTDTYPPSVKATQLANPDPSIINVTTMDGVGHVTQSQITSVSPAINNAKTYDGLGNVYTASNPHTTTASPTDGTTTYVFDALGRETLITEQDGSTISTTYSGNITTITDEAGHKRETVTDGLGRLNSVVEDPSTLDYVTNYTYDVLDDLLTVVQAGSHARNFQYDSLGRLTSSSNPETSGAITYTYDANGNVTTKTAPAPNQTGSAHYTASMTYDPDNRILTKSYTGGSPTAALSFTYDASSVDSLTGLTNPIGRLVKGSAVSSAGTTSYYSDYDKMGRTADVWNCVPSLCPATWHTSYTYDYAGNVFKYSDSIFASYGQTFDGAGRLTNLTSTYPSGSPTSLATVNEYFPPGEIQEMAYGNGLAASNVYNPRLQPCRITFNSSAAVLQACGAATPSGNFVDFAYGYNQNTASPTDNGSVASWTAAGKQTFSHNYAYDNVNRISSMTGSGGACTALNWTYDAWGNRTGQTAPPGGGTCLQPQFTYLANNQMSGYGYDSAGNLISQSGATYTYDNENRLVAATTSGVSATYLYDANGRRVQKAVGSNPATFYAYNKDGEVYAWLTPSGRALGYVYMNGQILAQYYNGSVYFHHHDNLGSTRLVTEMNQGVQQCMGYYPFGEEDINQCTPSVANNFNDALFTGKERDTESNLDNFEARYMASSLGRFMSPDPAMQSEILELPQTWNRYTYVYNRPSYATDPDGRCPPCIGAIIGGVVEGGFDLGKQFIGNGYSFKGTDWQEVGANVAGGAVAGALAGATAGGSLLVDAAVGTGANIAGGIVTRTLEGDSASQVLSYSDISEDAVSGFVGGGAGHIAADMVHLPAEPHLGGGGRRAVLRYNAKVAAYNRAAVQQSVRATVASSAAGHTSNGIFDWIRNAWTAHEPQCTFVSSSLLDANGQKIFTTSTIRCE